MADDTKPEVDEDPAGTALADEIRANAALVAGAKYLFGQELLLAQNEGGEPPAVSNLVVIKKLEGALASDRMYEQARTMTRRRRRV